MRFFTGFFIAVALIALWPSAGWARTVVPFSGTVDLHSQEAKFLIGWKDNEGVSVALTRSSPERYHLSLDISHLKAPFGDLSAVVEGSFTFSGASLETSVLAGNLNSHYTLLNYKPVRDLKVTFALRDRKVIVHDFSVGAISGRGDITLEGERRVNVSLGLLPVDLEEMVAFLGLKDQGFSVPLTGIVTGVLNLNGPLTKPDIQGRIAFYNGRLKAYEYDSIIVDLDGTWPIVRLRDSQITQAEGLSFKFNGVLDLSSPATLGTQFRLFQRVPLVTADRARREWVFKRLYDSKDMKTEMKYFLMKDDRGDASAVLGVQKSLEF